MKRPKLKKALSDLGLDDETVTEILGILHAYLPRPYDVTGYMRPTQFSYRSGYNRYKDVMLDILAGADHPSVECEEDESED